MKDFYVTCERISLSEVGKVEMVLTYVLLRIPDGAGGGRDVPAEARAARIAEAGGGMKEPLRMTSEEAGSLGFVPRYNGAGWFWAHEGSVVETAYRDTTRKERERLAKDEAGRWVPR